ncbi:MAG: putative DNA binding domain-containing protein [Gammaproteobacteria bacterium]|nr:putative DNA binding domain-containing protein [Gammaproteobacteria bacterium]
MKTICAFANDYHNINGGYVVIGVEEKNGRAKFPIKGLSTKDVEEAQKWIRGNCNRIDPVFQPRLCPEVYLGKLILVVAVHGSDVRPHRAPDGEKKPIKYWIRLGSETVDAEVRGGLLTRFLEQTTRIPWDDRRARDAKVEDLRETHVREFLRDVDSGLLDEPDARAIYRNMEITTKVNQHEEPRNVGLLFFSGSPHKWFRGAKIEIVHFAADRGGDVQEEKVFSGPLQEQYRNCMNYLENLSARQLLKQRDRSRVRGWVSYPLQAIRETLVNALYHRSYDQDQPEPVKIYLYPGRLEITSYPGPVPGIELDQLERDGNLRPVPARNRRIGDFFKELKLAERRMSGLAKVYRSMDENGSPPPKFDFDSERTYFRATLPAHPEYIALSALRDAAHLQALYKNDEAYDRLLSAWKENNSSGILAAELIRSLRKIGDQKSAEEIWDAFSSSASPYALPHVANTMIEMWLENGEREKSRKLMDKMHLAYQGQDAIDAAIMAKRLRKFSRAHDYFEKAEERVLENSRALHEFAQVKMELAKEVWQRKPHLWKQANRKLLQEARGQLERVIQMEAASVRLAWAWRDLARVMTWLNLPVKDIENAWKNAVNLLPTEKQIRCEYEKYKRNSSSRSIKRS